MMKPTETAKTLSHLATVLWNVVRMNGPWNKNDLLDISDYVAQSHMTEQDKDLLLKEINEVLRRN